MKQALLPLPRPRRRRVEKPKVPPQISAAVRRSGKVPHSTRPEVGGPIHVVLRIRRGLPDLRTPRTLRRLEGAFRAGKEKEGFGLVHYSIQRDHLHLMVEVTSKRKLARGMQGLAIRIAKALNRHWHGRKGQVFAERYFSLALKTLRQIWRATRYVLSNGRKHGAWTKPDEPDPYSSAPWFTFWTWPLRRPNRSPPVVPARTFCLWRSLDINEIPGSRWHELA